jgi:hypothetical protein
VRGISGVSTCAPLLLDGKIFFAHLRAFPNHLSRKVSCGSR